MTNHIPIEPSEEVYTKLRAMKIDTVNGIVYGVNGNPIGSIGHYGYVLINVWLRNEGNKKIVRLLKRSHIIYWAHHGYWPKQMIDHDNRIRHDDRIDNLKESTEHEQQQNTSRSDRDLPPGVYPNGFKSKSNPYVAQYWNGERLEYLGCHPSPEKASIAYQERVNRG